MLYTDRDRLNAAEKESVTASIIFEIAPDCGNAPHTPHADYNLTICGKMIEVRDFMVP
jgi:hypothetical protein